MDNYWKSSQEAIIYKNEVPDDKISVEKVKTYLSHSDDIIFHPFFFGGTGAHI